MKNRLVWPTNYSSSTQEENKNTQGTKVAFKRTQTRLPLKAEIGSSLHTDVYVSNFQCGNTFSFYDVDWQTAIHTLTGYRPGGGETICPRRWQLASK